MNLLFNLEDNPSLAIHGSSQRFPVRRVYCVGRNYAAHTREMGGDPEREAPFFFSKPASAVVTDNASVAYPTRTCELHHEVELVVALGKPAFEVSTSDAKDCIFGYAVGIDLTRRDLQAEAKQAGRPWDTAKGFDQSAPVSELVAVRDCGHPVRGEISLAVNGETRQQGDLGQMIWSVEEIIAELSSFFRLHPGDLIFTGTPAGVAAVQAGDVMEARIEGVGCLATEVE
jgi:fumarylpyruvate hydrolase